ncbi:MAG: flagellar hook-basal body complex protein FliE [Pirellulaceae bacterium]|jgi:flagellar hook-basal body complex protein FliE|nr:flagellar hook-basal body complex protein FliE [Pirellulaceae bacterium]
MPTPIQGLPSLPTLPALPSITGAEKAEGNGGEFKKLFLEAIDHVNSMQQNADRAVESLMTGGDANPAEVLTAVQKADMTFRTMLQIRNKLVQAYQEIREIRI